MPIIICPGIHEPALTQSFIQGCLNPTSQKSVDLLVFPGQSYLTLSAFHILDFLYNRLSNKLESPVMFICFSAGVIGGIGAATAWQLLGVMFKLLLLLMVGEFLLWENFLFIV